MGVGKGLTEAEAALMRSRLEPYKRSLETAGWHVPKLFHSRVVDIDGEAQIFSYEEFVSGGDGDKMIADVRQPNFRKWYLVEETLRRLYSYSETNTSRHLVAGEMVTLLPHGLDLKAANVVLEQGSDTLYFVDLFGPKELLGTPEPQWLIYNSKLDPLPAENLIAVCATREGAVLRFWRLARRLWETDRNLRDYLQPEFLDRLAALHPPDQELAFIRHQLTQGLPWLNNIYAERKV